MAASYRYHDALLPNSAAIAYAVGGYALGVVLLCSHTGWIAAFGVVLLAHAMIIGAYLLHDAAHLAIFRTPEANARLGTVMAWLTGACYAPFSALRHKHMRHHVDRADIVTFDAKAFLLTLPVGLRRVIVLLEWLYVPAIELVMHGYVMVMPFLHAEHRTQRRRVVLVALIRVTLFGALGWLSPKALLLYMAAWFICLTVLRFADAYQHTYDAFAVLEGDVAIPDDKVRDRAYEQRNTYSNLVSVKFPALNLLLLNFSYHNAHHDRPIEPWYRLPRAHRQLCGDDDSQVIPMSRLLRGFHRHRVTRLLSADYGAMDVTRKQVDDFYGAVGVSFLTAV
ncbi:fatty acid desaturase family protein [Paraburkholderia silvatlantica]|uniref:fatty acid desaturase family protein n=1 Tax=Paraburkholderia silvatlantica TaxID=321895 RepID=UPI0010600553|nr:fatty acid desaturase [Paraburkholderia silvatlantica]TDQ92281.1 fatty acid desaturase [Paraburkholderia silvatlantica]